MMIISSIALGTGVVLLLAGILIKAIGGAASSVLADEFKASAPEAAQKVIRIAARRIPHEARADVLETWLAEASQYEKRPLKALRFALVNCLAAAPLLARELRPVPETSLATQGKNQRRSDWRKAVTALRKARSVLLAPALKAASLRDFFHRLATYLSAWIAVFSDVPKGVSGNIVRLWIEQIQIVLATLVTVARTIAALFEPYDFSRGGRSLLQLVARVTAAVMVLALAFAIGAYVVATAKLLLGP